MRRIAEIAAFDLTEHLLDVWRGKSVTGGCAHNFQLLARTDARVGTPRSA